MLAAQGWLGWTDDHLADHGSHDGARNADHAVQQVDGATLEAEDLAAAKLTPGRLDKSESMTAEHHQDMAVEHVPVPGVCLAYPVAHPAVLFGSLNQLA